MKPGGRLRPLLPVAASVFLVGSCTSGWPVEVAGSTSAPHTISTHALVLDGQVLCTARLRTPVPAGHEVDLSFSLHNLTRNTVEMSLTPLNLSFVLRAADGTTYDTRVPYEGRMGGPVVRPARIAPGATRTAHGADVRVRWAGPLSITPRCNEIMLPPLRTAVAASGPAPSDGQALDAVVAASGHLFDACRPTRSGVPARGRIAPPSGDTPAMEATCSVSLEDQGSFLVAHGLVLVPPDMTGVQVSEPYEQITLPKDAITAEAVVWDFVVTGRGAIPVASTTVAKTGAADAMAPDWGWTGTRWEGPGGSRCGGYLTSGGGSGSTAFIEFISVCPRSR